MEKAMYVGENRGMRHARGFTLVELSLSMAFIGILSILIVLVIRSAVVSYHRGITLNLINTVGSEVVDDFRKSIQGASVSKAICSGDKDEEKDCLLTNTRKYDGGSGGALFGAFCTGKDSYVWSSGYVIGSKEQSTPRLVVSVGGEEQPVENPRLIRVKDARGEVCREMEKMNLTDGGNDYNLNLSNFEDAYYVLSQNSDGGVVVYDLSVDSVIKSGAGDLYTVSVTFGTPWSGAGITSDACDVSDSGCAINEFKFTALTKGDK